MLGVESWISHVALVLCIYILCVFSLALHQKFKVKSKGTFVANDSD